MNPEHYPAAVVFGLITFALLIRGAYCLWEMRQNWLNDTRTKRAIRFANKRRV
jgi:hypothetical protein